jgi:sulfoxide reductase heme-binding subunit YedZ
VRIPPKAERVLDRLLRPAVWIGGLFPFAWLVFDAFTDGLGAEPIENVTHRTGKAAITLLMVTLSISPVRRLTGWNGMIRGRRPIGLFAFFYACLHFCVYLADQGFSVGYIVEDVVEHPYVTAGFTALLLLIPLAVTSTRGWMRRLGKGWQKLHRLVYIAAGLAVAHFLWLVKKDLREPLIYLAVLAVLMALRLPPLAKQRRPRPRASIHVRDAAGAEG